MVDLEYLKQGLFTCFFANTKAGEEAWKEIAAQTQGTGKIFTLQLPAVLSQLRKAGFKVAQVKKISEKEKAKIWEEPPLGSTGYFEPRIDSKSVYSLAKTAQETLIYLESKND